MHLWHSGRACPLDADAIAAFPSSCEGYEPLHPLRPPVFELAVIRARLHKELHLHLLELARAEEKVLSC